MKTVRFTVADRGVVAEGHPATHTAAGVLWLAGITPGGVKALRHLFADGLRQYYRPLAWADDLFDIEDGDRFELERDEAAVLKESAA